jgi:hypothetical protein
VKSQYADYTCPNCKHVHEEIEYEPEGAGDQDAEYIVGRPVIDTTECQEPNCRVNLCEACPQFVCDGCGDTFCEKHKIKAGIVKYCTSCSEEVFASIQAELADRACMLCEAGADVLINEAGGLKERESVWHSVGVGDGLMECPRWRDHIIAKQASEIETLRNHCKTFVDRIQALEARTRG